MSTSSTTSSASLKDLNGKCLLLLSFSGETAEDPPGRRLRFDLVEVGHDKCREAGREAGREYQSVMTRSSVKQRRK